MRRVRPFVFFIAGVVVFFVLFFSFFASSPSFIPVQCVHADRLSYRLPLSVFEDLPSLPACIISSSRSIASGALTDFSFFDSSYYVQPEFYPSFLSEGIQQWTTPVSTHYGAVGFGSFPNEVKVSLSPGQTKHVRIFFHSGFGVRSFQGGRIVLDSVSNNSSSLFLVSLDENSSNGFLLGPTFPKFDSSWSRPVDVSLTLLQSLSEETVLTFSTASPPASLSQSWSSSHSRYFSITEFMGPRPAFRIVVRPS